MQIVSHLIMLSVASNDMKKSKEFYAEKSELETSSSYNHVASRRVCAALPGRISITLAIPHENMKPENLKLYFGTTDIATACKEPIIKCGKPSKIKYDFYEPGFDIKWLP